LITSDGPSGRLYDGQFLKYEKQDQQGRAAFNERNPHMTQQQEPMAKK
jgi:hypothetical protein